MPVEVRALLNRGFKTWRENLNLCAPFVFRIILIGAVVLAGMIPSISTVWRTGLYLSLTGKLLYEEAA